VQELRRTGGAALAAVFEKQGLSVCAGPPIEELMQRWRVRTDLSISSGFLEELSRRCAAPRLVVARLAVFPERSFLSARVLDTTRGRLLGIEVLELPREDGREDLREKDGWLILLERSAADLTACLSWAGPPAGAPDLIVLPTRATAAGSGLAPLFGDCLLKTLLAAGRWSIPDPALIVTALQAKGWPVEPLQREAIGDLGAQFAGAPLILSELIAYEDPERQGGFALAEESDDDYDRAIRSAHYVSLRAIDSRSGFLQGAWDRYREPDRLQGLFGVHRSPRWLARFDELAGELVHDMQFSSEVP
jgi:hypothetical protein